MKLVELFEKKMVFSFEIFPPMPTLSKTDINDILLKLKNLNPDFISVTYGAGGGENRQKNGGIVSDIKNRFGIESVAHLPCINMTKADIKAILIELNNNMVENILALRGDENPDLSTRSDFKYANELIEFIKRNGDFNIIAACYPEGHPESVSLLDDIKNMKRKAEAGTDHFITQLFLDNDYFYSFREKAYLAGIDVPISAGIMPVVSKKQIEKMVSLCKIKLPDKFIKAIGKYENNPLALRDAGIAYANDQIVNLISQGVDGIHLYTMNNPYIAEKICGAVNSLVCA